MLTHQLQTAAVGKGFTLEHHYVKSNGVTLHTVQAGPKDGELVVMLHGFPEFWYGWKYQIPHLVELGYRVVAPDQRGYNLSEKPKGVRAYHVDHLAADVIGLIDALGYEQVYLVGHDWGALVTWWTAAQYPERLKKTITLNVPHPTAFMENLWSNQSQMAKSWYAGLFQIPWLPEAISKATDYRLGARLMTSYSAHPDTFTAEDMALYKRAWARPLALQSMLNWYRAFWRYQPKLANPVIQVPMLLIWGVQDVALGREMALPSVEKYCANGRVVFLEEATHWVLHDEPIQVNELIERFFD